MKYLFFLNLKISLVAIVSLVSLELFAQKIHVDYIQTEGLPNSFSIEVWVSNKSNDEMKLSALNTVFSYETDVLFEGNVSFKLSDKFLNMQQPVLGNLNNQKKIRCTMIPVAGLNDAVQIGTKPELFGKLTFISENILSYPIKVIPSIIGNPTVQAVVYVNESQNSEASTLKNMTITTDEDPLILRLMNSKSEIQHIVSEVEIYPNPSTHFVNYALKFEVLEVLASASILNSEGRLLKTFFLEGESEGVIDLSSYSSGIYYILFENGENIQRHKVIKVD